MSADRYSRQSFLGADAEERIARCTVAVPGLGGGGSHVVQQLAHIGFQNYIIYDGDRVEESNLNRLVGAKSCRCAGGNAEASSSEDDDLRAPAPRPCAGRSPASGRSNPNLFAKARS